MCSSIQNLLATEIWIADFHHKNKHAGQPQTLYMQRTRLTSIPVYQRIVITLQPQLYMYFYFIHLFLFVQKGMETVQVTPLRTLVSSP